MCSSDLNKVKNDAVSYIRSLAKQRGRNADWAEKAVREGSSLNEEDALHEHVIDLVARNTDDLLKAIDGRTVTIAGETRTLHLANAQTHEYEASWRQLAAFVGQPCLPAGRLQGDLEAPPADLDYDAALAHLLEASPEMQVARAEVTRNQIALRREQVEPVPNLQVRVANGYDFETRNNVTSVSVGARIPLFDKNQGNIRAAQAELARSQAEVARVELSLRHRLAHTYARYRTAKETADAYRTGNLPEAKEAYELYLDGFRKRRAAWPQVLVAQRTYFQISVEYVEALDELRSAETAILGLLLVDGLDEPPAAPDEGRTHNREQGGPEGPAEPISPRGGRGPEGRIGATAASGGD